MERTLASSAGTALFINDIGPKGAPPIVVLHGGPAAHHDYLLPGFARLADRWRVVLYDQRGGGRSRVDGAPPPTLAQHLADLEAVLELVLASTAPPHQGYRPALERALAQAQSSPWVVAADPRLCMALTPFRVQARAADALRAEIGDHDFRDEVVALKGRNVLFIHGDRDPIDASLIADTARLMDAKLERLASTGHVPYVEAPEAFFSILRGFLGATQ